jgi:hypothetical protein
VHADEFLALSPEVVRERRGRAPDSTGRTAGQPEKPRKRSLADSSAVFSGLTDPFFALKTTTGA